MKRPSKDLTAQELRILELVILGKTCKEISASIRKTEKSIHNYKANILKKTNSVNMYQAIFRCGRRGMFADLAFESKKL